MEIFLSGNIDFHVFWTRVKGDDVFVLEGEVAVMGGTAVVIIVSNISRIIIICSIILRTIIVSIRI